MMCTGCFKEFEKNIKKDGVGDKVLKVSLLKKGSYDFNIDVLFPVHLTREKEITKGKQKGNIKEYSEYALFKATYCVRCGMKV